jgi:hypothetical protein
MVRLTDVRRLWSRRVFRALRAAVITLVLLFSVLAAVPTPGNFTHETLKQPVVQDQVLQWVALLRALGSSITEEELGDGYVTFAQGLQKVRGALLKPYNAVSRVTGTQQGWALFATPDQRPARLLVRAKFGRRFRLLYRSGDSKHDYAASFLEYRRVRALYNPSRSGPPATYEGFARQLSQRVFSDFPEAREVVVALAFSRTTLPSEAEDLEVTESHRLNFERDAP